MLFLLLGAAKHRHHPPIPTVPHPLFFLSFCLAYSWIHPTYIPLFCFYTLKSNPAALHKLSPSWLQAQRDADWAYPSRCCEFVVEESNQQLATEDLTLRWSDDRKTLSALNNDSLWRSLYMRGTQDNTLISIPHSLDELHVMLGLRYTGMENTHIFRSIVNLFWLDNALNVSSSFSLALLLYFCLFPVPQSLLSFFAHTLNYSVKQGYFPSHLAPAFSSAWIICRVADQLLPCVQVCNCNIWLCGCCCCIKQSCIHRSLWYNLSSWNTHIQTLREHQVFSFFCHVLFFPQMTCMQKGRDLTERLWILHQIFSFIFVNI